MNNCRMQINNIYLPTVLHNSANTKGYAFKVKRNYFNMYFILLIVCLASFLMDFILSENSSFYFAKNLHYACNYITRVRFAEPGEIFVML